MILTQRQLVSIYQSQGAIVIPYRARLTPSAQDWVRHNKIQVGYDDVKIEQVTKQACMMPVQQKSPGKKYYWWCDGVDGVTKAAIGMVARDVMLVPMPILEDASRVISAVRCLGQSIANHDAAGGVIVASNPAIACLLVNKSPNLRAVVAAGLSCVEEAIRTIAANVLIVQRNNCSLNELKNMLSRFCRLERQFDRVIESELNELLASSRSTTGKPCCGGCGH